MKTTVEEIINDFNKELEVAISIANNDKIKTIKHLINIASNYLEMEKEQKIKSKIEAVNHFCKLNGFADTNMHKSVISMYEKQLKK